MGVLGSFLWVLFGSGVLAQDSISGNFNESVKREWAKPETEWWEKHSSYDVGRYVESYIRDENNRDKIVEELSKYIDPSSKYFERYVTKPLDKDSCYENQTLWGLMTATGGYITFLFRDKAKRVNGEYFDEETAYYLEKILRANGVDPFWVIEEPYLRKLRCTILHRDSYEKRGLLQWYERKIMPVVGFHNPYEATKKERMEIAQGKSQTSTKAEDTEALFERWGKEHILCHEMDLGQTLGRQDDEWWGKPSMKIARGKRDARMASTGKLLFERGF